jgi:hypothetical protein
MARLLEGVARGIEADKALRNPVHVNTDLIPTDSLLHAAEDLLDRHKMYDELAATGATRAMELYGNVRRAAERVLEELKATVDLPASRAVVWSSGLTPEAADMSQGIRFLIGGVDRLLGAIERSPFAMVSWVMGQKQVGLAVPAGEVFRFDAAALAEIRAAVQLLEGVARQEKVAPATLEQDMRVMREAIRERGRDKPPEVLMKARPMQKQRARKALRELEKLGMYEGFQRARPRRYD